MTKKKPNQFLDLLLQKGFALHQSDKLDEAKTIYQQILSIEPNHFNALQLLGSLLLKTEYFLQALDCLNRALKIKPDFPNAYSNRGIILSKLKRFDEALANFDKAISIKSDYLEAISNRGATLIELKRFDEALTSFDKANSIKPNDIDIISNRGIIFNQLGQFNEALASFDKVINIKPDYPNAHSNKGITLSKLKRFDEALASFDKAISIKPDHLDALTNRGFTLTKLKRFDEAFTDYHKTISINANYAYAHNNLAFLNLLKGNYTVGWKQNEWRWKVNNAERKFKQPLWLGEQSLDNKTILLYAEQGLGDTIQFSRYVPLVSELGAKIILEIPRALVNLFKNIEGVTQIVPKGQSLPFFDYQCPLLSLPLAFKTELNNIPPPTNLNFKKDNDKILQWQNRLGKKSNPLIGLVWSSISNYQNDYLRSMTLEELLKGLPQKGFDYICLQKEIKEIDQKTLNNNPQIKFFGKHINDFSDDAHLLECVDLVISTCTSIPHLSSSLGKETWWLLSYVPDWRWLLDRNDSPWYPTAKLYRQEKIGDWTNVLQQIKFNLEKKFEVKNI